MLSGTNTAQQLYRYRWLLYELVIRELRLRYRGSALGFAWTLLNPVLFMVIYTLVFSVYLRVPIEHYPLYLLAGLVPWTWFGNAVQQGVSAVVDGRHYVGKTTFPTEVLIAVPVCVNAVNFLLSVPMLVALALVFRMHVGTSLAALPLVVALQFVLTLAIVQIVATFDVFYRDLQQLIGYAITALFYLTPIFYTSAQVPARFTALIAWNPFAALISAYQAIFYEGVWPSAGDLAFVALTALVLSLIAQGTFLRYREAFTEYL